MEVHLLIPQNFSMVLDFPQQDDDSILGTVSKVGCKVKNDKVIFSKFYSGMTKRMGHKYMAVVKYITLTEEMTLLHRSVI